MGVRLIFIALVLASAPFAGAVDAAAPKHAAARHAKSSAPVDAERLGLARELVASMNLADILPDTVLAALNANSDPDDPDASRRAKATAAAMGDVAPALSEAMAKVYAEVLDTKVLRAVAAFNRTPAGQGFIHKMPRVARLVAQDLPPADAASFSPGQLSAAMDFVSTLDLKAALLGPFASHGGKPSPMEKELLKALPEARAKITALYAQTYSVEELRAAAAFYRTPEGKIFDRKYMEIQLRMVPAVLSQTPAILEATEKRYCSLGPCTDKDREEFKVARDMMATLAMMPPSSAHRIITGSLTHRRKRGGKPRGAPPVIWLEPVHRP
jgi:hypothetical protein